MLKKIDNFINKFLKMKKITVIILDSTYKKGRVLIISSLLALFLIQ